MSSVSFIPLKSLFCLKRQFCLFQLTFSKNLLRCQICTFCYSLGRRGASSSCVWDKHIWQHIHQQDCILQYRSKRFLFFLFFFFGGGGGIDIFMYNVFSWNWRAPTLVRGPVRTFFWLNIRLTCTFQSGLKVILKPCSNWAPYLDTHTHSMERK